MIENGREKTMLSQTGIQDMLDSIRGVLSIDEILLIIKKIDALKVALESIDTFRQQSIKYAKMEAEALIRAVELGGLSKLRGFHRKTAEWLAGLIEAERDRYILMCEDGLTIDQVYKREVGDVLALKEQIEKINWRRDDLIQECREMGIVDIKPFARDVSDIFKFDKRSIGEDIIDGTRNRLRKAGAVGIGEDTGIYVMARPENSEEIKKAIRLRFESIRNDYESIKRISEASHIKMSYKDFDNGANWSFENHGYLINILLAFIDMGVISDIDDCIEAIDKTNFRKEVDYITKQFQISREDYIKNQYEKLFLSQREDDEV